MVLKSLKIQKLKQEVSMQRTHIILDVHKCDDKILEKADLIKERILKLLKKFGLKPKIETFYQFEPFGVTATVFSDSLLFALHTWPEHCSAAIDLYCFKDRKFALDVMSELKKLFKSAEYDMKVLKR